MRTCKKCNQTFPLEEFANAGTLKGVNYKRHVCKRCYYYSKIPRREKERNWIKSLKENKCCERCGFDNHKALQWHHKNPKDKTFNIADAIRYSRQDILDEIAKCELICANCHQIEHHTE